MSVTQGYLTVSTLVITIKDSPCRAMHYAVNIYTLTKGSLTSHGLARVMLLELQREGRDAIHFIHGLLTPEAT